MFSKSDKGVPYNLLNNAKEFFYFLDKNFAFFILVAISVIYALLKSITFVMYDLKDAKKHNKYFLKSIIHLSLLVYFIAFFSIKSMVTKPSLSPSLGYFVISFPFISMIVSIFFSYLKKYFVKILYKNQFLSEILIIGILLGSILPNLRYYPYINISFKEKTKKSNYCYSGFGQAFMWYYREDIMLAKKSCDKFEYPLNMDCYSGLYDKYSSIDQWKNCSLLGKEGSKYCAYGIGRRLSRNFDSIDLCDNFKNELAKYCIMGYIWNFNTVARFGEKGKKWAKMISSIFELAPSWQEVLKRTNLGKSSKFPCKGEVLYFKGWEGETFIQKEAFFDKKISMKEYVKLCNKEKNYICGAITGYCNAVHKIEGLCNELEGFEKDLCIKTYKLFTR